MENNQSEVKRGSEWRKWDLHIHTPGTKKNDQFDGSDIEDKWEKYITSINESNANIDVVGITDYWTVDNYFKFKEKNNDGSILRPFKLVLPNVELRVLPVTSSATAVNIHCIFNPDIDSEIENRFLSKLKFQHSSSSYSANKSELIRLGKNFSNNQSLSEELALKAGMEQYVVSMDAIRGIFEADPELKNHVIIVVANKSTDGVTGIVQHSDFFLNSGSALDATRQGIYQFSDAIFSSREGDRDYFLGKKVDDKITVIRKCGSLKPCFHGSDAHDNKKIFNPDDNRFCWIKADTTFSGLKQTLYEPEDRVRIQAFKPDVKNERHIISTVEFIDSGNIFGNKKIPLNENLNAIIGGKSSGKSLLLYSIAKSIDPEQVLRTSRRLNFDGYSFEPSLNFKVTWQNGDADIFHEESNKDRKITYIPQLYINHLVEKNNKDELNSLVDRILLQDSEFKVFYDNAKESITGITNDIELSLSTYLSIREKGLELQQKLNDIGKSASITKSIQDFEKKIADGQKLTSLTKSEFDLYNKLVTEKTEKDKTLKINNDNEILLNRILNEIKTTKSNLLGTSDASGGYNLKGTIDRIIDEAAESNEELEKVRLIILSNYELFINKITDEIANLKFDERKVVLNNALFEINKSLKPLLDKISGQKELEKLTKSLEDEKKRLQQALGLEKQLGSIVEEFKNLRLRIGNQLQSRYDLYKSIIDKINTTRNDIGSGIILTANLNYKKADFELYEQANRASIAKENFLNSLFNEDIVNYDLIPKIFENKIYQKDNLLYIGDENEIPLRLKVNLDDVLRGLIKDSFKIDYRVNYKGDELLSMSPGKKGTVLLILFLQISSAEFPILIDQPEDNLDNRTIYELLCMMIKEKKKERQIIIVSHNANLVVSTDTENIIVANQEGQDSVLQTGENKFDYINGSLEHSIPMNTKIIGVLNQQGIKEHVCDILEGGTEAFEQRRLKYRSN